jgi:energy-coupling factor transporter ATP-binding protein EcfA2
MKIAKLITWHWGSLEDREWAFSDTVLLTGESGSGKSTLLDAIQTLLTAAHHHVVQFNAGQDESTQSRRGGKEPRTLAAYALGQQADGVFLRRRSTSFVAIVFDASEASGEREQPFTVIAGVEAREDGGKAVQERIQFFIVRRAINLQHLIQRSGDAVQRVAWPLKDLYLQLQHQLRAGPETVQRFEDKSSYLTQLYGALMGKAGVAEAEAFRASKAVVKAMAYKELGNVNDLVRDEILDPHDFSRDLDKMRDLMRSMSSLKAEAERLQLNIERLEQIDEAGHRVLDEARRFVVMTMAHAIRAVQDAQGELESVRRQADSQRKRNKATEDRLLTLRETLRQQEDQLDAVKAKLAASDVAQRKTALESEVRSLTEKFRLHWSAVTVAAGHIERLAAQLAQLFALDLAQVSSVAKPLADAIEALRPATTTVLRPWRDLREHVALPATLDAEFPAFDLEAFDANVAHLEPGIRGGDESLYAAVLAVLARVERELADLDTERIARDGELRILQSGRSVAPAAVGEAIELLERELPKARPTMLAQLIEPGPGTTWLNAIEGYMGGDRFAIIVEAGMESACTRLVKRRFPVRSPKVVQGSKAIADTQGRSIEPKAVVHELVCQHPVAKAFLHAQYGRVRKVESEEELARTAQGLMEEGVGSRGYGMFTCRLPDHELAFGERTRQRRRQWCEAELARIGAAMAALKSLQQSVGAVGRMFQGIQFTPLAPIMAEVLSSQLQHGHAARSLAALDLSSIEALEAERQRLETGKGTTESQIGEENQRVGENNLVLRQLGDRESGLLQRLPELDNQRTNALVWATRYGQGAAHLATEAQLVAEAGLLAGSPELTLDALRHRMNASAEKPPTLLREVSTFVSTYLTGVRTDQERFVYGDPPKTFERIEEILPAVSSLLGAVAEQVRRQRSIGLAENLARLQEAEASFNSVFTTSFCFKVRDDIRQGATTLQKLNRQLKSIRFGTDSYELQWDWVPRLQKVYEFFEAMEDVVDRLEREQDKAKGSIFDSPLLADAHRETAQEIRRLLLANDQGASERALKELADYRNYRRYDIIRHSPVGQTKLSTWGTGSGGELETPFYVVRSAVLAHALGHFGRDRQGAPALRLMLSDEAFSKMDESRSRSVLRFLARDLGLQLVVAMPTSKSGAVKPQFDKEFTFSKVLAMREGRELFVSEVQEKTLKREALGQLWTDHAQRVREAARLAHEAVRVHTADSRDVADAGPAESEDGSV